MAAELVPYGDVPSLAEHFARSGLFLDVRDASKAVVKILAGRELGLGPVAAMRGVRVVEGKVELSAGLLASLVKRSERYDYQIREATDERCVLAWLDRDKEVGTSSFTLDDARRAKLLRAGSGWEKYPSDMLFARALSRGVRRYAPDVTAGAAYVEGETSAEPLPPPETTPPAPDNPDAPADPQEVRAAQAQALKLEGGDVAAVRARWVAAGVAEEQVAAWTFGISAWNAPTYAQLEAFRSSLAAPTNPTDTPKEA